MKVLIYRCPARNCQKIHTAREDGYLGGVFYTLAMMQVEQYSLPHIELTDPSQEDIDSAIQAFEREHPIETV